MSTPTSPYLFWSPPTLASTPSISANSYRISRLQTQNCNVEAVDERTRNNLMQQFEVTKLPVVVLDKVFLLLSNQDLRCFHQVSKSWKYTLEDRRGDNNRRLQLVREIRENKENIQNNTNPEQSKEHQSAQCRVIREKTSDMKPGSLLLNECTNVISNSSTTKDISEGILLTPTSSRFGFQSFEEAERSLLQGQTLFQCRRCLGPVPSPILSREEGSESHVKIEATRCRLISRMDVTPNSERKKSKAFPMMISPIDNTTTLSLGERTQTLVISGAGLVSFCDKSQNCMLENTRVTPVASNPCIDMNSSTISKDISIDCHLNFSNPSLATSFGYLKLHNSPSYDASNVDMNFNTSHNITLDSISMNDSGGSFFTNLILSPESEKDFSNCIPLRKISTLTVKQEDFKKPITLNSSQNSSVSTSHQEVIHDKYDIASPTYKSHNKNNDIIISGQDLSLIVSGDRELSQLSTNVTDAFQSLNPKLSNSESISTSDYYSWRSVMRTEIDSKSFIPEVDSVQNLADITTGDNKSRSQSLGNLIDSIELRYPSSFDSSSSCPNLNESFILECPNPKCSFRFCSSCLNDEHLGKPCRSIDSQSIEELHQSNDDSIKRSFSISNSFENNKGKGKGKSVCKGNKSSKEKLRRLARL